jgi:peptidoglycan hydrolase CwlO-like protein
MQNSALTDKNETIAHELEAEKAQLAVLCAELAASQGELAKCESAMREEKELAETLVTSLKCELEV